MFMSSETTVPIHPFMVLLQVSIHMHLQLNCKGSDVGILQL
jgi:hypothetical protein